MVFGGTFWHFKLIWVVFGYFLFFRVILNDFFFVEKTDFKASLKQFGTDALALFTYTFILLHPVTRQNRKNQCFLPIGVRLFFTLKVDSISFQSGKRSIDSDDQLYQEL